MRNMDTYKAFNIIDGTIEFTDDEWKRAIVYLVDNVKWQMLQGYHGRTIDRIIRSGDYKKWKKEIVQTDLWKDFGEGKTESSFRVRE